MKIKQHNAAPSVMTQAYIEGFIMALMLSGDITLLEAQQLSKQLL